LDIMRSILEVRFGKIATVAQQRTGFRNENRDPGPAFPDDRQRKPDGRNSRE
jgi:hypothetical protein